MTTNIIKENIISMVERMDGKEIDLTRRAVEAVFTMNTEKKDVILEKLQIFVDAVTAEIQ